MVHADTSRRDEGVALHDEVSQRESLRSSASEPALGGSAGDSDWRVAHDALVRLAHSRAGLDFDERQWLLAALRSGAHRRLGYGSFAEYIERLFGHAPRLTHDKLRVAKALETLPELKQALRAAETSWSVVRELTRVATPETEGAWLSAARGADPWTTVAPAIKWL